MAPSTGQVPADQIPHMQPYQSTTVGHTTIHSIRHGGIVEPPVGYATGGIAKGSSAGYPAVLHGKEAVVPLPNGNSIPVELRDGAGTNNISITVNMNEGGTSTQQEGFGSEDQAAQLGKMLSAAVQQELQNQKRPGGILSPYGAA